MCDRDDTVNLCPRREPHAADETLVLAQGDSFPNLTLAAARPAGEPTRPWRRFADALLRALAPWHV